MTRELFVRRLVEMQDDVLVMSSMVEKAIARAVDALDRGDVELARRVVAEDGAINRKRFEIEERTITMIATQAPVAADLRVLVSVLNVIVELERMGDHAEGIAKLAMMIGDDPDLPSRVDLVRMSRVCIDMLQSAGTALVTRDDVMARAVIARDDEVDAIDDRVYQDLLAAMQREPSTIEHATYLLWASHNLERIADRVTNICQRVIFVRTGVMREELAAAS